jgi:hypothetical protein
MPSTRSYRRGKANRALADVPDVLTEFLPGQAHSRVAAYRIAVTATRWVRPRCEGNPTPSPTWVTYANWAGFHTG